MGILEDFKTRSKGGKNAWKNIPKSERSKIMSERAKKRWTKIPKKKK